MTTPTPEAPVVEQVDRDAAASVAGETHWFTLRDRADIIQGRVDGGALVQAFARHRSLQRDDVLEEAAKVAEGQSVIEMKAEWAVSRNKLCADIAAAIRALRSGGGGGG